MGRNTQTWVREILDTFSGGKLEQIWQPVQGILDTTYLSLDWKLHPGFSK